MAQVNFRIDDETKRQAEGLFGKLGLTMTSAIMVFIRQSINEHGLPFRVCDPDAFAYHEKLLQARQDWEEGRRNFHYHDLVDADDVELASASKLRRPAGRRRRTVS